MKVPSHQAGPSLPPPRHTIVLLTTGAAFGFAMNKGQVYLPMIIMEQMAFQRFTMMKMFVSALGMSFLSKAVFRALQPDAFQRMQSSRATNPSTSTALILGGLVLGAGMTVSGSCPGSVYVQLGAQIPSALACLAGTALGAGIAGALRFRIANWQKDKPKVATTMPLTPMTHGLVGVACLSVAAMLEVMLPEPFTSTSTSWRPSVAGAVVGALQLPMAFLLNKSLGASAGIKIALGEVSNAVCCAVGRPTSWLPRLSDASQALFVLGIIAGSYAATSPDANGGVYPSTLRSVLGGAMIAFGASLAGGCTSGHGLSGTAMLMSSSWLVLPSIFLGGMTTAALQYLL
ncbi:hypothetical protein SPRG_19592 [Saprolegnia parasitica CBS 223.65]|uniref:Uncharacterized protein n=1 Tax=Saprolegnia parasitica (strain CBS 223.65) TaxID=695850 RepID=A0A067CP96_SAPPC|nr:hypothetical protein SPRG_19592 [Saprolegnia parasitica CBS 223.65]KDO31065.1 hypothetical protein SPRG_19592 [Saprolegnia parasitica CBS 223.65]|eukprot:XP_012198324.1 hypothetical protein SPRG_19592 [Saprolegnia parasitica CBS 223.65]